MNFENYDKQLPKYIIIKTKSLKSALAIYPTLHHFISISYSQQTEPLESNLISRRCIPSCIQCVEWNSGPAGRVLVRKMGKRPTTVFLPHSSATYALRVYSGPTPSPVNLGVNKIVAGSRRRRRATTLLREQWEWEPAEAKRMALCIEWMNYIEKAESEFGGINIQVVQHH